jgi:hypothetical protein
MHELRIRIEAYVYEKDRVFRRLFGPKRDEVTWGLKKLHSEEPQSLYI